MQPVLSRRSSLSAKRLFGSDLFTHLSFVGVGFRVPASGFRGFGGPGFRVSGFRGLGFKGFRGLGFRVEVHLQETQRSHIYCTTIMESAPKGHRFRV